MKTFIRVAFFALRFVDVLRFVHTNVIKKMGKIFEVNYLYCPPYSSSFPHLPGPASSRLIERALAKMSRSSCAFTHPESAECTVTALQRLLGFSWNPIRRSSSKLLQSSTFSGPSGVKTAVCEA